MLVNPSPSGHVAYSDHCFHHTTGKSPLVCIPLLNSRHSSIVFICSQEGRIPPKTFSLVLEELKQIISKFITEF